MIVWMLYSALIALIVAAAARAAEWLARLAGYRLRWIWIGGLALTTLLSASAALRGTGLVVFPTAMSPDSELGEAVHVQADAAWRHALRVRIESLRRSLDAPVWDAAAIVRRGVSPAANVYAASLSSVISIALVVVLVGVGRRFRIARREWPLVAMQGVDVRVSPRIGPVVIGVVRPEIVVPRWLLTRPADEQRLVVAHEGEHVRARDPLLLGLAWGAVVIAPWSPAVWYMLSRLRLAVELDCDARVLRRGAAPQSYGSLLIEVAQHASALRLSALALADDSSHLHQRLLAMKPSVPRFARLRAGLAAVFAFAGLLVACQATLPNQAEIDRMDVATETRELAKARQADTTVAHTVDGAKVPTADSSARGLDRVPVIPAPPSKPTETSVEIRKSAPTTAADSSGRVPRTARLPGAAAGQVDSVPGSATLPVKIEEAFTPIIFIDGARATVSEMRALDRERIESVEVLKGRYAEWYYGNPDAAKGVIVITTKRTGGTK